MSEQAGVSEMDEHVRIFWERARPHVVKGAVPTYFGPTPLEALTPPSWSFGASPEQAHELLGLVLAGTKTATASALWDYETEGEPVPAVGNLSIVLDGDANPRAVIQTTAVETVPFNEVDAEHARREGEGDLSLEHWREVHEWFFTENHSHGRGFSTDMPVVCEQFKVLYSE